MGLFDGAKSFLSSNYNPYHLIDKYSSDVFSSYSGEAERKVNEENLQFQKDTQKTTWEREDNAVQRRVEDLERSGLSRTLAAGSSAGAVLTKAPQASASHAQTQINTANQMFNLMKMKKDISKTDAEINYINQQSKNVAVKTESESINRNFQKRTLEDRILLTNKELKGKHLSNEKIYIENEFQKRWGESDRYHQNLYYLYRQRAQAVVREKYQADIIAKKLWIEEKEHNLKIYKKHKIPTNIGWDWQTRLGAIGIGALEGQLEKNQEATE